MIPATQIARLFFGASLLLLCGCEASSKKDAVESAGDFLALVRQGKTEDAYNSAAFAFQARQSFKNFAGTAKELGLTDFTSLKWTRTKIGDREAKLDGEIATKSGEKIVMAVTMIRESGEWKLYSLRTPGEGEARPTENRFSLVGKGAAFNDVFNKTIPPESRIRALVRESLLKFNDAIQRKDFGDFYKYLSLAWQAQLVESRLQKEFQPFIDAKVNLDQVTNLEAVLDPPPQINSEGLLVVRGYYPTTPYRSQFKLEYMYELPKWRLFGIDVQLVK